VSADGTAVRGSAVVGSGQDPEQPAAEPPFGEGQTLDVSVEPGAPRQETPPADEPRLDPPPADPPEAGPEASASEPETPAADTQPAPAPGPPPKSAHQLALEQGFWGTPR
jgi:hypothetical protein